VSNNLPPTASIRKSLYLSSIELVFTKIFYLADRTQFACTASSHACKPLPASATKSDSQLASEILNKSMAFHPFEVFL
jgi:hypothetical protein